ncbi:MAG: Abi family protein [Cyclobacteriaceae bacterium]
MAGFIMKIQKWVSDERFNRYLQRCGGDESLAKAYYESNVAISQACYIILEALEITLRNKVHHKLSQEYNNEQWYDIWLGMANLSGFHSNIEKAKDMIDQRGKVITPGKVVAEFTLGFWIQMFNASNEKTLWKPLRSIFSNLPKKQRQRYIVSRQLNKVRKFRNRIFHYESIAWNFKAVNDNYKIIREVLHWLEKDAATWADGRCSFEQTLQDEADKLTNLGITNIQIK